MHRHHGSKSIFLTGLLAAFCAGVLTAQDYRARLQGIVTDSSRAIVVGAQVALRNDNTGVDAVRMTGADGRYLFDFVEPGAYTLTVESPGFSRFVQRNVLVQVRGDVTVNAALAVGGIAETVTVEASAVALQFNTSTMELTVNGKMLADVPVMQRNPFTLALLDPAVVNRYGGDDMRGLTTRNPYFMWASTQLDVGGTTTRLNDILLDGAPLAVGQMGSYSPPMDAVQEFSVQQNSVDAEFGHSAGGIISVGMKSGTNQFHGTAYYFGRNPKLNAASNSVTHTPNKVRNHNWGATLGNPILKNRLFTFTAYEASRTKTPSSLIRTQPTDLERQGDFSRSLNNSGGLRAIFDPWTTVFNPATSTAVRTPFPGNVIPSNRLDPTAVRFMQDIWKPNGPGDGPTGVNNYRLSYALPERYFNFSERVDWNISDKWKVFGRASRILAGRDASNQTGSPAFVEGSAGAWNNRNVAGDMVYVLGPGTVLGAKVSYTSQDDVYDVPEANIGQKGLAGFWPNNPWYTPYVQNMPAIYYPRLSVGSAVSGLGYWYDRYQRSWAFSGSIRNTRGRHNLKAGVEGRRERYNGIFPDMMQFSFPVSLTADTFVSPNTALRGSPFATFLLGALDSSSYATTVPYQEISYNFWAGFVQDDIKLTSRVTLNLGLRYEFGAPPVDRYDRFVRYVDLDNPIPEMQSNPPRIPANVAAMMNVPYRFNGALVYSDNSHRGMYDSNPHVFAPRVGLAVRINEKTAFRAGAARYIAPPSLAVPVHSSLNMEGFSSQTNVAPVLQGVPSARIGDPFPASSNPLILPIGKAYGRYTSLGNSVAWNSQSLRTTVSNRFNVSLQRELPGQLQLDITYFLNFSTDVPYGRALNMADPQLAYTYKGQTSATVANPFYRYLTPEKFPGSLRNQATVSVGSLLRPYPQYGSLTQNNTEGGQSRYSALQIKAQRRFRGGFTYMVAYNFNRERNFQFFNDLDQYANRFTWQPATWPHHRLNVTGTYEFPFGKGRAWLNHLHPVWNGILGGWSTSGLLMFNSGSFLSFGQMITDGATPEIYRDRNRWFDTSKFTKPDAYTPRTNPLQYPGLTGPRFWSLDSSISKYFPITERFKLEFKLEAYNTTNVFVPTNPDLGVQSATFGKSTNQNNQGRSMQYNLRLHF